MREIKEQRFLDNYVSGSIGILQGFFFFFKCHVFFNTMFIQIVSDHESPEIRGTFLSISSQVRRECH